mmetsp:Transcript_40126/g.94026  ORF Transcript_40126/g.94026 Transcript_40126/m.94026 type:complete len:87 (+) Transcript_40126:11-271(+)
MAAVPLEDLYAIDTSFVDTQEEEEVARQLTASQARVTELEVQLKDASKQVVRCLFSFPCSAAEGEEPRERNFSCELRSSSPPHNST